MEHIQHTVWFSPYFNPRAPCGARQGDHLGGTPLRAISIHAPHAGRDRCRRSDRRGKYYFNPRAPCGARRRRGSPSPCSASNFNPRAPCGARQYYHTASISDKQFQSTRPVRGATWRWISSRPTTCYFNPRAPCGARPVHTYLAPYIPAISIHAPRAGRDISRRFPGLRFWISIHAPRAGRDCLQSLHRVTDVISIHAPRAGRDSRRLCRCTSPRRFQSTRPVRGATSLLIAFNR